MIRETLQSAVAEAVQRLYSRDITSEISYSDARHGDFSSNVAFQLAKDLKQPPAKIAEELAKAIKNPAISSVKAAAGFINLSLADDEWGRQLAAVAPGYANNNGGQGQTVQVEFISANPTGPLTLGNGRGGYSGDVLANVLAAAGYQVSREYYLNDAGGQVTKLIESVKIAAGEAAGDPEYRGDYVAELARVFKDKLADKAAADQIINYIVKKLVQPPVAAMGVDFDNWFSENQQLHQTGKVEGTLKMLKEKQLIEEKDGALWLKGRDQDNRERVLVKSDGSYTYLLVDIAYHWNKLVERKFDKVINLWGADHAAQAPSLLSALEQMGLSGRLDIVIFQLVRLISGGKVVKVSKRAGTYVTLDELLEQIPSDVARFFFLMRSPDTHMDFDLDLAKQQSQKNPYYYVMYAYVRAQSILGEASKKQLQPADSISQPLSDKERRLIRQLIRLPEIVVDITKTYEVHHLTFYGMELAKAFHDYYEDTRIIGLPPDQAQAKLAIINKFKLAMEVYFSLLGVKPLERM